MTKFKFPQVHTHRLEQSCWLSQISLIGPNLYSNLGETFHESNPYHEWIQEFLPGGSRPDCQKTALTFFVVVFLVLNLFYSGLSMIISKKIIIFQGFRGGPTFSGGIRNFPGWEGGPTFSRGDLNANLYRNP